MIKILQDRAEDFARQRLRTQAGVNNETVVWSVQVWPALRDQDKSGLSAEPLFCLKLCYSFNFVNIKAAEVAFAPLVFALQKPAAVDAVKRYYSHNPVSTRSPEEEPFDSRNRLVSRDCSSLYHKGWYSEQHDMQLTRFRILQLRELDLLSSGGSVPGVLCWIDAYLQWFTLGITKAQSSRPQVTNHCFRPLSEFTYRVGTGDATGVSPEP